MECGTIVVGVDDSPQARAAVHWAAEQARLTGCALHGVHVLDWPRGDDLFGYVVVADQVLPSSADLDDCHRRPSEEVFAEVHPDPGWRLTFAQGHPGQVLVDVARDARMLVLGACEHTGVMRLLNGSTGHYCLNHTVCPVVAVPCATSRRGRDRRPATAAGGR